MCTDGDALHVQVSVFTALTSAGYIAINLILEDRLHDHSYATQCAVGFSGTPSRCRCLLLFWVVMVVFVCCCFWWRWWWWFVVVFGGGGGGGLLLFWVEVVVVVCCCFG